MDADDIALPDRMEKQLAAMEAQGNPCIVGGQIAEFNKYNPIIRTGDQYRIGNVFEDNMWDAWMFVAKDKSEAVFTFVQVLGRPNYRNRRIKLKGLDEGAMYKNMETGEVHSGSALMNAGIFVALHGDFSSKVVHFVKV